MTARSILLLFHLLE